MCSTQHVFTPHKIKDFGPFGSMDEALAFQKKMRDQQMKVYYANKSYWINNFG